MRYVLKVRTQKPTKAATTNAFRESSTFVSKHVELPPADVAAFLNLRGMTFRVSGGEIIVKECPFCHSTGGKLDNMWKLYIGLNKGWVVVSHATYCMSMV